MSPRIKQALAKTILFFAIFHLVFLFFFAIVTGKWNLLNLFVILDVHLAYPPLAQTRYAVLGALLLLAVFLLSFASVAQIPVRPASQPGGPPLPRSTRYRSLRVRSE